MNIGFIGIGIMGKPMSLNLIKAGFNLTVYNRTPSRCEPLKEAGAAVAGSPREVAEKSDVIITIVSDTPDVEAVLFGENGVIEGIGDGKVVIDMSTISPIETEKFAKRLAEKGAEMLDAPVSGGDTGAIQGTLSIMVGGKPEVFERCKPIFEAMGKTITHIGPNGDGQKTKMVNQCLVIGNLLSVVEAVRLIRHSGLNAEQVLSAVSGGAAGSWQLSNLAPKVLQDDFAPGFMIKLLAKDLRIADNLIDSVSLDMPGFELCKRLIETAMNQDLGDLGTQGLFCLFEK